MVYEISVPNLFDKENSMLKKTLSVVFLLTLTFALFANGNKEVTTKSTEGPKKKVTIEVVSVQPEYIEQERQVWDLYMEENPNVTIKVTSVNEDQMTAFMARVAANEGPAIMDRVEVHPDKSNYTMYANLLDIGYPYWDKLNGDPKGLFEMYTGVKGYVPSLDVLGTFPFTFIYYKDAMKKAGLDPSTIRTWGDVDAFLAKLKKYVDKTDGIDYVLDTGWEPWVWGRCMPNIISLSLGADPKDMNALYTGKISWTDLNKNPMVPFFKKMKEYYDKGYLPKNWWTRDWENEFEAGFINKKSIFTLHGPWIWDKVIAANPSAQLGGVVFPAAKGGKLPEYPRGTEGAGILAQWVGTPEFPEIVKAFNWYNSPKVAEMRAQYVGSAPVFKTLSKDFSLKSPQFLGVIKPAIDGAFGDGLAWDTTPWAVNMAAPHKVDGKSEVLEDDAIAEPLGKYLSGSLSLADFMSMLEQRWKNAYNF